MKEIINKKQQNKNLIIILVGILFLYNAFKFLGYEGSKAPILSTIFNMIIFLFILILLIHKKDLITKEFKQKILDDYFQLNSSLNLIIYVKKI